MLKLAIMLGVTSLAVPSQGAVSFPSADTPEGYIGRLLINEAAFPGERGFVSEDDSKAAMAQVLWVLESRINYIPPGYRQREIAMVQTTDVLDVITGGGVRKQIDGFYRDEEGKAVTVPRVEARLQQLLSIANRGEPGRFARMLEYGANLARDYVRRHFTEPDRFAELTQLGAIPVTGRAYSWMTDRDYYNPGGSYLRIPGDFNGLLAGNRFFTLRKRK